MLDDDENDVFGCLCYLFAPWMQEIFQFADYVSHLSLNSTGYLAMKDFGGYGVLHRDALLGAGKWYCPGPLVLQQMFKLPY